MNKYVITQIYQSVVKQTSWMKCLTIQPGSVVNDPLDPLLRGYDRRGRPGWRPGAEVERNVTWRSERYGSGGGESRKAADSAVVMERATDRTCKVRYGN